MEEFRHHINSVHAYLETFVRTATKGNVVIDYALHVERMRLRCNLCQSQLTVSIPSADTDIDYPIQEFVKCHAHQHSKSKPTQDLIQKEGQLVPLTCDFKKIPLGTPMIDDRLKNVAIIETQMAQYDEELEKKKSNGALESKIKALRGELVAKGWLASDSGEEIVPLYTGEDVLESKAELQALKNILLMKKMEIEKQKLLGQLSGQHATPVVKKEKPLKIATGRKFR